MLDIVKIVAEIVAKALSPSSLSEWRRNRRLRTLGANLFALYIRLNDIVDCGERILGYLEDCAEPIDEAPPSRDDSEWTGEALLDALALQNWNIARFQQSLRQLARQLEVIDAASYRGLTRLMLSKRTLLDEFRLLLRDGRLPLARLTERDVLHLMDAAPRVPDRGDPRYGSSRQRALSAEIRESVVDCSQPLNQDVRSAIKRYLASQDPQGQLATIGDVSRDLRAALERYFSIQDVLVDIDGSRPPF